MDKLFVLPNPCVKRWTDLSEGDRSRFCETCRTQVHDIERYSAEEADRLWRESGGHVCVYLGGESAEPLRSRRAVLVGAFLTAISPLFAQAGRVRIRVTDVTKAVVPGAEVSLLNSDGGIIETRETDGSGESHWNDLPLGDLRFQVRSNGFKNFPLTATIRGGDPEVVQVVLEVAVVGESVEIYEPGRKPLRTERSMSPKVDSKQKPRRWWQTFR